MLKKCIVVPVFVISACSVFCSECSNYILPRDHTKKTRKSYQTKNPFELYESYQVFPYGVGYTSQKSYNGFDCEFLMIEHQAHIVYQPITMDRIAASSSVTPYVIPLKLTTRFQCIKYSNAQATVVPTFGS